MINKLEFIEDKHNRIKYFKKVKRNDFDSDCNGERKKKENSELGSNMPSC